MTQHKVIGKALRKVDAVAKVTGATRFADDLAFPRMLYCKLLRSTQPLRASCRSMHPLSLIHI